MIKTAFKILLIAPVNIIYQNL